VVGVEPDPIQASRKREADVPPGLFLLEGRAKNLPVEDGSVDGIFFFRSLHHVPIENMAAALREAARAVKPNVGFLYVIEPG
jgi:ubiquinone/menaquinone biosynthesis C-methylase UbiE